MIEEIEGNCKQRPIGLGEKSVRILVYSEVDAQAAVKQS